MNTDVAIIGAGPIGLELAAVLQETGVEYEQFDAGQVGQTICWYPRQAQFFSSPDRIAIAGVALQTPDQSKATREQYLAYLRGVVEQFDLPVHTYTRITHIERNGDGFTLACESNERAFECAARRVVVTIGDMHRPRMLDIPGEDLPHVSHYFDDPHRYFRKRLLIVGGRNSAVEAAIRCFRAGANVALSYRHGAFPSSVKYWLKPEIEWLIKSGQIGFHPRTTPVSIAPGQVRLRDTNEPAGAHDSFSVPADFVLLLTGYEMDATLLTGAGVALFGPNAAPRVDAQTMETNVRGVYVAGTAAAGTQLRFRLFIENCHSHVVRIARALTGEPDLSPRRVNALAYSRLHEHPDFSEHGEPAPVAAAESDLEH